jgi:hypothetical protein
VSELLLSVLPEELKSGSDHDSEEAEEGPLLSPLGGQADPGGAADWSRATEVGPLLRQLFDTARCVVAFHSPGRRSNKGTPHERMETADEEQVLQRRSSAMRRSIRRSRRASRDARKSADRHTWSSADGSHTHDPSDLTVVVEPLRASSHCESHTIHDTDPAGDRRNSSPEDTAASPTQDAPELTLVTEQPHGHAQDSPSGRRSSTASSSSSSHQRQSGTRRRSSVSVAHARARELEAQDSREEDYDDDAFFED